MSEAVRELFDRIQRLPSADRLDLEDLLARQAEVEWQREAAEARRTARQNGLNQETIDRAVERVRYGS